MDLRWVAIMMVVVIVMDVLGRLTRRGMAEQDPALEGERGNDFLTALMEAGRERPEGAAEEREGEGKGARGGVGTGGERASERPKLGSEGATGEAVAARRPPSALEVLAGIAAPARVEAAPVPQVAAAKRPRREGEAVATLEAAPRDPSQLLSDPATVRARNRVARPRLSGDRRLRQAIVAREILGPPVALRHARGSDDGTGIG